MIAPTTRDLMLISPLLGFWFIPELLLKAECSNCLISDVYQHYCSPRLIALIDWVLVYTSAIAHQGWLFLLLEFWCIPVLLLTLAYCSYCSGSDLYQHYCSPRLIALIDWVLVYTSANAYLGWLLLLLGFWCIPVLLLTSANCFYCLGSDVYQYTIAYLGWLVLLLGIWCIPVYFCLPRLSVSIARVLMYTSIPLLTLADWFYCSDSDVYQYTIAYLSWLLLLLGFLCIPVYHCLPRLIGPIARVLMYTSILLLTSADCFYCSGSNVYRYTIAYLGWLVPLLGFWCIPVYYCLPLLIASIARVLM